MEKKVIAIEVKPANFKSWEAYQKAVETAGGKGYIYVPDFTGISKKARKSATLGQAEFGNAGDAFFAIGLAQALN